MGEEELLRPPIEGQSIFPSVPPMEFQERDRSFRTDEITPDYEERLTSLRHTPRLSAFPPSPVGRMEAKAFASTHWAYYSYR